MAARLLFNQSTLRMSNLLVRVAVPKSLRSISSLSTFKTPPIRNEPNVSLTSPSLNSLFADQNTVAQPSYSKGSVERRNLQNAINSLKRRIPIQVPLEISGKTIASKTTKTQSIPSSHSTILAEYVQASENQVHEAIENALAAKKGWEATPFESRAAVFLRAAELIAGKYRYDIIAATMLGQGKNIWQAEIDAAAESCDFLRFNVHYASELYKQQNTMNDDGVWNRMEYRPLEGFVYAISPFNFTAIGVNLVTAPAIMGNVVIWKPSDSSIYSSYLLQQILQEAGLPKGVVQFLPGDAETVTKAVLKHSKFAALHFTGSTGVFRSLYGKIADGVTSDLYEGYPRVVGETGGKNFHLIHGSADVRNAVVNTVRGAFEYQGQKCSATSRVYVAESIWPEFKKQLIEETERIKVGSPESADNFAGPVIHERSWGKLDKLISESKADKEVSLLTGGKTDRTEGWYIYPTIFQTGNHQHELMKTEFFGPILSVYVFPDAEYGNMLSTIDKTTKFALTGAVFARDRDAILEAEVGLRHSAGNFYINSKSSGAVVGHQPFGGARASGTNDKATSVSLVSRFVSMRTLKEDLVGVDTVGYPSNEV